MRLTFDEYAHLNSVLHRWDPRFKLIGFLTLIFAYSAIREMWMLPVILGLTLIILAVSRLPAGFVLARLRYPSFFILMVIIVLPFASGNEVITSIGPLDLREEGLRAVLLIVSRFLSIVTIGIILFGTSPFLSIIKAMRALGLPSILTDMILLTFRYLFEIGDYLHRMETALKMRGFRMRRFSMRGLGILAWLGGSILVRSYQRSQWVYKAMILRGYGQQVVVQDEFRARRSDILLLLGFLILSAALVVADMLI